MCPSYMVTWLNVPASWFDFGCSVGRTVIILPAFRTSIMGVHSYCYEFIPAALIGCHLPQVIFEMFSPLTCKLICTK